MGFRDDCCCSFNTQRLSCCALTGSYCHSTSWTHQRCAVNLHNIHCPPCPCTAEHFSMCNLGNPCSLQQEMLLAAVFCDVELAAIWRFAWHISAAISSPTLRCLICGNWPSDLGLRGLSSDVHQLSGRTQLTRVLLQHLIFDRTLNNRLRVLCAYLYQQQHSSQCRWNWEVTCHDNDKLSMFHMSMRKWWWQLCGTLKPDASSIPDTVPFNLLRAMLDFAVLCMTSSLAVTLWDSLLLRFSEQNWSAGFTVMLWTYTDRLVYFLACWVWKRTSIFFLLVIRPNCLAPLLKH